MLIQTDMCGCSYRTKYQRLRYSDHQTIGSQIIRLFTLDREAVWSDDCDGDCDKGSSRYMVTKFRSCFSPGKVNMETIIRDTIRIINGRHKISAFSRDSKKYHATKVSIRLCFYFIFLNLHDFSTISTKISNLVKYILSSNTTFCKNVSMITNDTDTAWIMYKNGKNQGCDNIFQNVYTCTHMEPIGLRTTHTDSRGDENFCKQRICTEFPTDRIRVCQFNTHLHLYSINRIYKQRYLMAMSMYKT